jgi:hypothetical protein
MFSQAICVNDGRSGSVGCVGPASGGRAPKQTTHSHSHSNPWLSTSNTRLTTVVTTESQTITYLAETHRITSKSAMAKNYGSMHL